MKHKILQAIPSVFSLRNDGDYGRFVVRGGADKMMRDTWISVGKRLNNAVDVVAHGADGGQKPAYVITDNTENAPTNFLVGYRNLPNRKKNSRRGIAVRAINQTNNSLSQIGRNEKKQTTKA